MRKEKSRPIIRSKELVALSREHHDGLLLSWKINAGINNGISVERIKEYIMYFIDNYLEAHLADEEENIFTLLARDNAERREAELQHARIRVRIEYLYAGYAITTALLKDFASVLSDNIRFEERILFNVIEKEADPRAIRRVINKARKILKIDNNWHDQFWLKTN